MQANAEFHFVIKKTRHDNFGNNMTQQEMELDRN